MILYEILAVKEHHGRVGSTLGMGTGLKNKKIGFYPKSLRAFLNILCVVDDSIYACSRNSFRVVHEDDFGDLAFLSSQLIILIGLHFYSKLANAWH